MTYLQPLLFVFLAVASFGLWRLQAPRRGKILPAIGIAGIFLCSWPPAEWLWSRILTARYPTRPFAPLSQPQAIVVFGESMQPPLFEEPYPVPGDNTYRRLEYAVWIYRRYGPLPILVSGGVTTASAPSVAATMREVLRKEAIPDSSIWLEDRSRSTHENAVFSAQVLRQHAVSRVALVVDATSMPRAAACLRKSGLEVMPAPCVFHDLGDLRDELLPNWRSVRRNEETLHELLGLVWYRMHGWI